MENKMIEGKDLAKFKKAYKKAIEDGEDTFTFKGGLVLVSYAKHVIEYLESKSKKK